MGSVFDTIPRTRPEGAENIRPFGVGETDGDRTQSDDDISLRGQATLDVAQQLFGTISTSIKQFEARLARAVEQLNAAEDRHRALEQRANDAEAQAAEAEKWLVLVHEQIGSKFAAWIGPGGRDSAPVMERVPRAVGY